MQTDPTKQWSPGTSLSSCCQTGGCQIKPFEKNDVNRLKEPGLRERHVWLIGIYGKALSGSIDFGKVLGTRLVEPNP